MDFASGIGGCPNFLAAHFSMFRHGSNISILSFSPSFPFSPQRQTTIVDTDRLCVLNVFTLRGLLNLYMGL